MIERPLPHNADAERGALGAILVPAQEYETVFEMLRPEHFLGDAHRRIYQTLLKLREEGKPTDLLSLHEALLVSGELEAAGGVGYIAGLGDGLPQICRPRNYAHLVREKARLRAIIHAAEQIQTDAFEQRETSDRLLDVGIEKLSELARDAEAEWDDGVTHFEASRQALMELGENPGPKIYTGIAQLDRITGGFRPGELIVITAETGSGKTLLAQQTRTKACADGYHSLFCSGEMLAPHLKRRELAAAASVAPSKMRREDLLTDEDRRALIEAATHQCKLCRILDGELDLARIRREARRMKAGPGLDLVVLDYDELIEAPGKDEFEQQRNLARAAKSLAMELRCVVILISQLRKPLSGEDVKRPTLQRIYGTGAKVKHASIVVMADREYVRELTGDEKEAQIFVLKNRDGRVGRIKSTFNVSTLRFEDAPPSKADSVEVDEDQGHVRRQRRVRQ